MQKKVAIYTDGSCLGNPGPGGFGTILLYKQHRKELSGGFRLTTNNRMELLAAIIGLESLKDRCEVELTTDSQYVRLGITQWLVSWKRNNWRTSQKQAVKNQDLWQRLDAAASKHSVNWHWVKAHNGHSENERCDELARTAATLQATAVDSNFEESSK